MHSERSVVAYSVAALALVALACGAATAAAQGPPAPADAPLTPACQRLHDAYAKNKDGSIRASRSVSAYGQARALRVYHGARAPSRAAAALLAAALRHAARYRRVHLHAAPAFTHHDTPSFCSLAYNIHVNCTKLEFTSEVYDNLVVSPAIAWVGKCSSLEYCLRNQDTTRDRWVEEPRLQVQGPGGAGGAPLALHLHLAKRAPRPACDHAAIWTFYKDTTFFDRCAFEQTHIPNSSAIVYILENHKYVSNELRQRISAHTLHLDIFPLDWNNQPRTTLMRLLKEGNSSFLFIDYDLWQDVKSVKSVTPPPPLNDTQPTALESITSVKVADDYVLREIAPPVLDLLQQFAPTPTDLREILELEASDPKSDIQDAACAWAINNTYKITSFQVDSQQQHWIAVFLCANDPDKEEYKKVANAIVTDDLHESGARFKIGLYFVDIDCANEKDLNNEYFMTTLSNKWQRLIGVVASGQGLEVAAESAAGMETALVFYGVPGPRARLGARARAAAGSVHQLAAVLAKFLATFSWKRLALLTEDTELAKGLYMALGSMKRLTLHNVFLNDISPTTIVTKLKSLQNMEARIIFVNTNATTSETIICQAHHMGMTSIEYVWILRERRAAQLKCNNVSIEMEHFTISFWWRGDKHSRLMAQTHGNSGGAVRIRLNDLWGEDTWPPLAAPLSDALQVLIKNFKIFADIYTNKYYDLHGYGTTELLLNSHNEWEMNGVVQRLQFVNGTIAKPLVFVDRWKGYRHEPLHLWRVGIKDVELLAQIQHNLYSGNPPKDGSQFCIIPTGDPFFPQCRDRMMYVVLISIFLICLALYSARRMRVRRLGRRDALLTAQLLAQRETVASALAQHYVDRAAFELYHELGHGCYGRVRYGVLRAPERPPLSVAVKESRDDVSPAEESELLREACTIAALRHDHVVRLIGVCTTGGPLLVLMEYAFFGDLREYLCQRRHLAERMAEERFDETDEMYHVSAVSLTRLAKEAASALEYLAQERLVHRDVRASNCLVDARRSLKLGDFGLARCTGTGQGGEAEYACRRRGLFPVLWMAPESLERGVFTAASDAWALGVLLLELVTLGARPYAAWPPLRVMRYVSAGGRPPLPADASPDTRRILAACWLDAPEERLTAGALVALLEASPEALRPALLPPAAPADEDCPAIAGALDHSQRSNRRSIERGD